MLKDIYDFCGNELDNTRLHNLPNRIRAYLRTSLDLRESSSLAPNVEAYWVILKETARKLFSLSNLPVLLPEDWPYTEDGIDYSKYTEKIYKLLPGMMMQILRYDRLKLESLAKKWERIFGSAKYKSVQEVLWIRELWATALQDKKQITISSNSLTYFRVIAEREAVIEILYATRQSSLTCEASEIQDQWMEIITNIYDGIFVYNSKQLPPENLEKYLCDLTHKMTQQLQVAKKDGRNVAAWEKICFNLWPETAGRLKDISQYTAVISGLIAQSSGNILSPNRGVKDLCDDIHQKLYQLVAVGDPNKLKDEERILWNSRSVFVEFVPMGIYLKDSGLFGTCLTQAFQTLGLKQLTAVCKEKQQIYEEVFADLGMCAAFRFDPFAYLRFTLHMFIKERGSIAFLPNDFSAERFLYVVNTILSPEDVGYGTLQADIDKYRISVLKSIDEMLKGELFQPLSEKTLPSLKGFIELPFEKINCEEFQQFCKTFFYQLSDLHKDEGVDSKQKIAIAKEIKRYTTHLQVLAWMLHLWASAGFYYDKQPQPESLQIHLRTVYHDKIKGHSWVTICQNEQISKEISKYYASKDCLPFTPETSERAMAAQSEFILKYYCKSRLRLDG